MSAVLTSSMPVTRPKIHRLPAAHARKPEPVAPNKTAASGPPILWAGWWFLGLLAAIPPQKHEQVSAGKVSKAALVPEISVKPDEKEPAHGMAETKLAMVHPENQPVLAAQTPTSDQMTDESRGKTIILQGKNESIIGQMARIPMENEQITEIKSVSDVDNTAGRELLSIINKY